MKFKYLLIIVFFFSAKSFSQENKNILFTINNEPYYSEEFLTVYKKNLQITTTTKTSFEGYLKLFINYKLKVKEARFLGIDTLPKFKKELKQYKENLIKPYLKDDVVTKSLVKEAYERLKKEINVSHILVFLKPNASPKDTLKAYNKLIKARNLVIEGADFTAIAKKYSEDTTVDKDGGNVGYFTALQMVYPFEDAAYSTKIGEVSMPFKTKFGYHILKVNDIKDTKGEVEVAHIMFKNDSITAKKNIDSVYNLLIEKNVNFFDLATKVSEDKASAKKGGRVRKFGTGQMLPEFSKNAFSINNENEISKPFKTQFGWHIIKLIKKHPVESFEKLEAKLTNEINKDTRSNLIGKSVINKLFKQYTIVVHEEALQQFNVENWKTNSENFNKKLLLINDKEILQDNFVSYLKSVKYKNIISAFENFKEEEVITYFKEHIESTNSEFANMYNEFKEGLLLFDLLETQIWEKAKDSAGLSNYFNKNKALKYKNKAFKNIKGTVISDYQSYLEEMFTAELHEKYEVKINNSEKKSLKKIKL